MAGEYRLGDLLEHPYTGCVWSIYEIDYETQTFRMELTLTYQATGKTFFELGAVQNCSFVTMDSLLEDSSVTYGWTRHGLNFEIET